MEKQRLLQILPYLPSAIQIKLKNIIADEWIQIEEIRLRSGSPLTIGAWGESCFVTRNGGFTNYESDAYKVSSEEVQTAFSLICENSVYAHLDEIQKGYITIKGGHRVGICGKVVKDGGEIKTFREISSLNFRIANQVIGVADGVIDTIIYKNHLKNTLVIAPPQMGKTTFLRDITRQISNKGFKCGVADDRGEIAAIYKGLPTNQIGAQTDVIDGASKAEAIEILIRTMSPKVIITDEIVSSKDVSAILSAVGTGIKIIASTHGSNIDEVKKRSILEPLFKEKIFEQAIILHRDFSSAEPIMKAISSSL